MKNLFRSACSSLLPLVFAATVTLSPLLYPPTLFAAEPAASWQAMLQRDIEYLASDSLRGRSAADETIVQAAQYLAQRMVEAGLRTDAVDGSPYQPVKVRLGARAGEARNNRVVFRRSDTNDATLELNLGVGMNPLAIGTSQAELSGPVIFAGYGITAPDLDYDDYKNIDASGAVVLVLRKEPGVDDPESPFNGTENTRHAFFATKVANAIKHGVSAMILINDPASVQQSVQRVRQRMKREESRRKAIEQQLDKLPEGATNSRKAFQKRLSTIDTLLAGMKDDLTAAQRGVLEISTAGDQPPGKDTIPVLSIGRDTVDQLLQTTRGKSLTDVESAINEANQPQSFVVGDYQVDLSVELKPTLAESSNVIGVLPGRGELAEETVVVGAHYDHVGMGGYGSLAPGTVAVHNGADDNASGTATMLAIAARMKAELEESPTHRRVVFIAFTAEERGLVGSKAYVAAPLFPLEKTVAMINLDMVGRLRDNELTVYGTGTADGLDALVETANASTGFDLYKVKSGYGPSDHQSFYTAGVPVLFFFTGLHNDYHRPSDDFDKIDFGGLSRITDIVSEVTSKLATTAERPTYAETENRVQIRRQLTAFLGVSLSQRGDHVVLSGISAEGPAERGGLQIEDRLEKLGKRVIQTVPEVLQFMRQRSPGDRVKVQVQRNGESIEKTIQLEARPGG